MSNYSYTSIVKPFIFHLKLRSSCVKNSSMILPSSERSRRRILTWMLLWAKKGQNDEWKLTSTFLHPNCCNPWIISSVKKIHSGFRGTSNNTVQIIRNSWVTLSKNVTFDDFMIFHSFLGIRRILSCFLCFHCFWRKLRAIGRDCRAIFNINHVLVSI